MVFIPFLKTCSMYGFYSIPEKLWYVFIPFLKTAFLLIPGSVYGFYSIPIDKRLGCFFSLLLQVSLFLLTQSKSLAAWAGNPTLTAVWTKAMLVKGSLGHKKHNLSVQRHAPTLRFKLNMPKLCYMTFHSKSQSLVILDTYEHNRHTWYLSLKRLLERQRKKI